MYYESEPGYMYLRLGNLIVSAKRRDMYAIGFSELMKGFVFGQWFFRIERQ